MNRTLLLILISLSGCSTGIPNRLYVQPNDLVKDTALLSFHNETNYLGYANIYEKHEYCEGRWSTESIEPLASIKTKILAEKLLSVSFGFNFNRFYNKYCHFFITFTPRTASTYEMHISHTGDKCRLYLYEMANGYPAKVEYKLRKHIPGHRAGNDDSFCFKYEEPKSSTIID